MLRSIYSKFILGYIIFGLVGLMAVSVFSQRMVRNYLVRQNTRVLSDEVTLMAATYEDEDFILGDIGNDAATSIELVASFVNARIFLVNPQGDIILDSEDTLTGETIDGFEPQLGHNFSQIGDFYGTFSSDYLSCMAPINHDYSVIGYIVINYPMSLVTASTNEILRIVYLTAVVIFILSLVILLVFTIYVYRPLKSITAGAKEYANGNLGYKIELKDSHDEISYLSETLNYMAMRLDESEIYQRDFISNVSHDFRSPLTSIKGYLTAILDGTIPPESQEKYLQRVISEAERLSKLSESMITLSSEGSGGRLNLRRFDINETIRDVCNANENACRKKNIRFELVFERENELVLADEEKIKQVLYNLIDNAIKFSARDSSIRILTRLDIRKVWVSIRDSGIGISEEDLPKIWDRFYKADTSRGKDPGGTGLGLTIVREIIQAHNENINCVSSLGEGSTFSFTLTQSE